VLCSFTGNDVEKLATRELSVDWYWQIVVNVRERIDYLEGADGATRRGQDESRGWRDTSTMIDNTGCWQTDDKFVRRRPKKQRHSPIAQGVPKL